MNEELIEKSDNDINGIKGVIRDGRLGEGSENQTMFV